MKGIQRKFWLCHEMLRFVLLENDYKRFSKKFLINSLTLPNIFGKFRDNWGKKLVPISGKDMRKLFYDAGFELVPGGGKGSHWKLKRKNGPTVTVPNHKELKKV
jgi:predicted RNA binding protein YcfA (HicA-like mRNA interferase family)